MKRKVLTGLVVSSALVLLAARPSIEDLQAQVDAIGGREVVTAASPVDTSLFKSETAQCPAGKVSTGGGGRILFAQGSGTVGQVITNSYPDTEGSWFVSASSPTTPSGGWQLVAYAVCVSL